MKTQRQRGVSLIEALVAMAVMAFGMLGMVGVQATLRLNSDVAKQRSEALRLGQRAVEDLRSFTQLQTGALVQDYADIVDNTATPVTLTTTETGATNTAYRITQSVGTTQATGGQSDPRMKPLRVSVSWLDRTGNQQRIELNSVIAGVPPDLAGTLLLAGNVDVNGVSTRSPLSRSRSIPVAARDLGNGSSGYMPPNGGNVALLFDNLTAVVKLCETTASSTAGLTAVNITNCSADPGQLLSGTIRFNTNVVTPTAATAENPTGTALNLDVDVDVTSAAPSPRRRCFDDAPITATAAASRILVNYLCVVLSDSAGKWSGTSVLVPRGLGAGLDAGDPWTIAASGAGNLKVCRYTVGADDTPPNPLHPRSYVNVYSAQVLTNQNFLVIQADATCPIDTAADPASGNFVNSNTRQHQP